MSGYNKYRRNNNYPYRRGVGSYRKKSSVSKRATGNIKSAYQQKDSCSVVLNHTTPLGMKYTTDVKGSVAALNVYDALLKCSFFNNYAPMYDQFRIDKIKAKFTALEWPTITGGGQNRNITVVTAFDRNGLDDGQILIPQNGNYITTNIGKDVSSYSSALTKNLNLGAPFELIRYISPSTIAEKSQFVSCDSLRGWYKEYNEYTNKFELEGTSAEETQKIANNRNSRNPCYLLRDEAIPFKPTYLIGVIGAKNQGNDPNSGQGRYNQGDWEQANSVIFNCELDICCTFRGLRKSQTV